MTTKNPMTIARAAFKKATKLSEIALLALDDMEGIIALDEYGIYMGDWHTPLRDCDKETGTSAPTGKCGVCLSGSVMAQRFVGNPNRRVNPEELGTKIESKLLAINEFRVGDINEALNDLDSPLRLVNHESERFEEVAADFSGGYMDKKEAKRFVKTMRKVANELAGMGL